MTRSQLTLCVLLTLVSPGCATVQDAAYVTQAPRPAAIDLTAHILREGESGLTPRWTEEAERITYGTDTLHRPDMLWAASRAEVRLELAPLPARYVEGVRIRCAFIRDRFAIARR